MKPRNTGFSVFELLITLAVVAVFSVVTAAFVQNVRPASRAALAVQRAQALNSAKQIYQMREAAPSANPAFSDLQPFLPMNSAGSLSEYAPAGYRFTIGALDAKVVIVGPDNREISY